MASGSLELISTEVNLSSEAEQKLFLSAPVSYKEKVASTRHSFSDNVKIRGIYIRRPVAGSSNAV